MKQKEYQTQGILTFTSEDIETENKNEMNSEFIKGLKKVDRDFIKGILKLNENLLY